MTTHKNEKYENIKMPRSAVKRLAVITVTVILAVALMTTAIAKGGDIITYLGNNVWSMSVSSPDPIDGYSLANETGEYLAVDWVVGGEIIGMHREYVFGLDNVNGRHILSNIAFDNGEMILIKPVDGIMLIP